MPLLINQASVRIPLSTPGEWVEAKPRLTKDDEATIQAAAIQFQQTNITAEQVKAGGNELSIGFVMDYKATVWIGLEVGLTGWSFAPEVPLTPETLRAGLAPEDYDIISTAVNELWRARTADERKNFETAGSDTSKD